MLVYRIGSIPDLSLSKYQAFADSGIDGMLAAQLQFIRQLNRVLVFGRISAHFLFSYDPGNNPGEKLTIFLCFRGENDRQVDRVQKIVKASGISRYYDMKLVDEQELPDYRYTTISELAKKERFLQTSLNNEEQYFYIVPNWELTEESRLYSLFKLMESFDERCCYRVDLFAEENLSEEIHDSFARPLSYLRNISSKKTGISELSRINTEQRDPSADEALHQYEDWIKAVDSGEVFLARICVLAESKETGQLLLDAVVTECIKSGNVSVTNHIGEYTVLAGDKTYSILSDEKTPKSLAKWSVTFTADEVAAFTHFPVLYDGENIELRKETAAIQASDGMIIGTDTNGYSVKIPYENLPKHMFVCGVPGAGKTNTMLHIANSLWNDVYTDRKGEAKKRNIPFLVLEPAKREYRELSTFDIPELLIFSPSASTDFPLEINPFEFPMGLTLSEHIGRLCQVFEGAFPIAPPAPFILDRAIQAVYEKHGWDTKDVNQGIKEYPTISELYDQFEKELLATNYDSEIQGNIRSVLEMRIGSLLRREMKDIFDAKKSTLLPEEWLEKPVIIELEALGEGPANFVTLLLCTLIRETLKANPNKDKEKPIRHVIFIEEAHNLVSPKSEVEEGQDSNPKIAATRYIVKMLAEVRALREGIIIADQLPTAMAPEVIKNTNIKLVHRLTSEDDRELVGSTMSANGLQLEAMAVYTSGQALMSYEKLLRPFEMRVSLVESHGDTPDDAKLLENMKKKPGFIKLRTSREEEKFDSAFRRARKLNALEQEGLKAIEEIDFASLTEAKWMQIFETHTREIQRIQLYKTELLKNISVISNEFFDENKITYLAKVVSQIGDEYSKRVDNLVKVFTRHYMD